MAERFTVIANAKTGIRNRGYDDGFAGREKNLPDEQALRPIYLASYRRGCEARAAATRNG